MVFEVLSNPEKWRIYDQHGVLGIHARGEEAVVPASLCQIFRGRIRWGVNPEGLVAPRKSGISWGCPWRTCTTASPGSWPCRRTLFAICLKVSVERPAPFSTAQPVAAPASRFTFELGWAPGMMHQTQTVCSECHSKGKCIDPKLCCKKWNGRKVNRKRKILEVQIDKGMEDGQITFGGERDQEPGLIVLAERSTPYSSETGSTWSWRWTHTSRRRSVDSISLSPHSTTDHSSIRPYPGNSFKPATWSACLARACPPITTRSRSASSSLNCWFSFRTHYRRRLALNSNRFCHPRKSTWFPRSIRWWTWTTSTRRKIRANKPYLKTTKTNFIHQNNIILNRYSLNVFT